MEKIQDIHQVCLLVLGFLDLNINLGLNNTFINFQAVHVPKPFSKFDSDERCKNFYIN